MSYLEILLHVAQHRWQKACHEPSGGEPGADGLGQLSKSVCRYIKVVPLP